MTRSLSLRVCVAVLLVFGTLGAQQSGQISGVVTDAGGAVIVDAQVHATNVQTGAVRTVQTNASGTYVLSPLLVGQYRLRVEKPGFGTVEQSNLVIDINSALTLNLTMQVGSVRQEVSVAGTAPAIDTENQELGNYRYSQQLVNLPIIVREVNTLVGQTAGVPYGTGSKTAADTDTVGGTFSQGNRSAMQVIADGGQLNPFQTTGYPAIDGIGRRADLTMPNVDTLSEFKLVTNGASAEYPAPVTIIVATKSGTNALHGSAYEFYQSGGLAANRWELPTTSQSFVRHQFGGSASGPIKKDKMFFMAAAEEFSHSVVSTAQARYPTAAERSGDLSGLLTLPRPVTVFDPLTHLAFAGNRIPSSRLSPISVSLLQLIPNAPAPPGSLANFNALYVKPLHDKSQKYDGRYDWNPNQSNFIFGRTTIGRIDQASRYAGTVPGDYGFSIKNYYTESATASWTHIINPTTLFKMSGSWRNEPFQNIPSAGDTVFPIPIQSLNPQPPFAGPPAVTTGPNAAGISNLVDRNFLNFSVDHDFQINPSFHTSVGNHSITSGAFFLHGEKTQELASPPWGQYTTASDYNNARSTISATGDAYADFLLGYPSTTDVTAGPRGGFLNKTDWSLFFQDDWRVTPKLTVNLGLRYDNFGFFTATDGRAANADFGLGKIVIPQGSEGLIQPAFQSSKSLFVSADQVGLNNSLAVPVSFALAPRLGFAYRLSPTFVIRGGAGIYNTNITYNEMGDMINSPPFTYRAQLSRALLTANGVDVNTLYTFQNPTANGSTAAAANTLSAFGGFTSKYPIMQAYEYNLTLEKQLGSYAIRASYVGNLGRNLSRTVQMNACPPGPVVCLSRPAGSPGARQWAQFGTAFSQHTEGGNSTYSTGEVEVSRRFTNGLLFDVNYSYARLLAYQFAATNPVVSALWRYDYGPVTSQPTHVFHFNYVYDLPFGHGRAFGANMNALVNGVLGGWELSGIGTWQSGQPLTALAGVGQSPTGATANRADRICDGGMNNPSPQMWFNAICYTIPGYINSSAANPARQFGSAGIGTIVGPRWFSYDANLQKHFKLGERFNLALRVDAFNLFNHPVLGSPDVTASSPTFGQIRTSNVNYNPRAFQLGSRLTF